MRGVALVGLVAVLMGCGPEFAGEQETQTQGAPETSVEAEDIRERWCNSYTTQQYCPKNVCAWDASKSPSCTLPAASAMADGPCEKFTSPKTCPSSYCAWYGSPAHCGPYIY